VDRHRELTAIFLGGAIGALVRAGLVEAIGDGAPAWPWVTFAVNVAGCLLLGYFITRLQERLPLSTYRRPLLGTGFCGALTTFSTMQVELLKMFDAGRAGLAAAYLLASVLAGYAGVQLASAAVRRLRLRA
jgi:CrcB protein